MGASNEVIKAKEEEYTEAELFECWKHLGFTRPIDSCARAVLVQILKTDELCNRHKEKKALRLD